MKHIHYLSASLLIPALMGLSSCVSTDQPDQEGAPVVEQQSNHREDYTNVIPGTLVVKLTPEQLASYREGGSTSVTRALSSEAAYWPETLGEITMTPLFLDEDAFRERRHEAGLDRWMIITYKGQVPSHKAKALVEASESFEAVELQWAMATPESKITPVSAEQLRELSTTRAMDRFDDPLLPAQWHYYNDGHQYPHCIAGADINLLEAWQVETGKPGVVVCVVDGGIDYKHPDLAGHVDVERSFNFVLDKNNKPKGKGNVYDASGHGTHVAGTIAAVNNNGIGVCGIAGGDGTPGTGVTLINAQVFGYDTERSLGGAAGIAYGADHGAVISQNSWGYRAPGPKTLPEYDREAIDYFVRNAGKLEDGTQDPNSPMAGGVVIFAAGNDGLTFHSYPGSYEGCISVASIGWDFQRASYSNSGDWVSISAPGGDQNRHFDRGGVLSTVPTAYDKSGYGYMQGTSMACPHVSGVAALIVSKYGRMGYTSEMLKQRLLSAVKPYSIGDLNQQFRGQLGSGYLDAAAALLDDNKIAPEAPAEIAASKIGYTEVTLSWSATADEDGLGGTALLYRLYYSESPITSSSLDKTPFVEVYGGGLALGKTISRRLSGLKDGTTYYVGVVAVDRFGNTSGLATSEIKTKVNAAPVIIEGMPDGPITLDRSATYTLRLKVSDADSHKWTYRLEGDLSGITSVREDDTIVLTISGAQHLGEHALSLILTDEYGKTTSVEIPFKSISYQPVTLATGLTELEVKVGDTGRTVDLSKLFTATPGYTLTYEVASERESLVSVSLKDGILSLTPRAVGYAPIRITATDGRSHLTVRLYVRVVR